MDLLGLLFFTKWFLPLTFCVPLSFFPADWGDFDSDSGWDGGCAHQNCQEFHDQNPQRGYRWGMKTRKTVWVEELELPADLNCRNLLVHLKIFSDLKRWHFKKLLWIIVLIIFVIMLLFSPLVSILNFLCKLLAKIDSMDKHLPQ